MIPIERITDLDRLAETVPKPKGALLKFGLPKWKMMPLEHKIPLIPGPKNAYNLTRCKVGTKLWVTDALKIDFDLSDPYCHETKFPYDALHDQHLLEFFSKPINQERLLRADLITKDMDAKCSLREYNAYRKYLRKIHATLIGEKLREKDRLSIERRTIQYTEEQARKEVERLKKKEELAIAKQHIAQQRLLQKELEIQKRKEKAYKVAYRFELSKLIRQEEKRLMNVKRKEQTERIRQKCYLATQITRRKIIQIYADWRQKDKERRKAKDKQLADIARYKQNLIEERWREKLCVQEKDMMMQKMLLQRIHAKREKFINNYKNKMDKETARMQKLLDNAKLFTACYVKRRLPSGRLRICCKRYGHDTNQKIQQKEMKNNFQYSMNPLRKKTKQTKHQGIQRKNKSMRVKSKRRRVATNNKKKLTH